MARIPDDFVQDLLNRVDIVDVVERYLPLKKTGLNYAACCPFHKEKSPSFTVSPNKQFYHCFGCGAHGSAISFVMEYESLGFVDAVGKLAESVGMKLPVSEPSGEAVVKQARVRGLTEQLTLAMQFYRAQLKGSPTAIAYLKRRGLTGEIAARFGLGYAPAGWQGLAACFPDYASNAQLAEAGLVIDNEDKGRRYDRFRDRVMFPIFNQKQQVIGFGGRILDSGEPKYLNSPETPVFEKGRELYGLPQARGAIRDQGRVLVVEGYMDVVALAQHGVEYAVASLGTACTPEHIQKLLKLADEVYFCFDGDNAGRKAAWRALENALPLVADGKKLAFLFLPAEHDPDSYIREYGKEAFEATLARDSLNLIAYLIKELSAQVELSSEEGRARLIHLAKPYQAKLTAPVLAQLLRQRLAELSGLESNDLARLQGVKVGGKKIRPALPRVERSAQGVGRRLLLLLLLNPLLAAERDGEFVADRASLDEQLLAQLLAVLQARPEVQQGVQLIEALRDAPGGGRLPGLLVEAEALYQNFGRQELRSEWMSLLAVQRQLQGRGQLVDRKAALEYQAANGGLTDAEKLEYLQLVQSARPAPPPA